MEIQYYSICNHVQIPFVLWDKNLHHIYPSHMDMVQNYRGNDLGVDNITIYRYDTKMILYCLIDVSIYNPTLAHLGQSF